jgi:branched-chain amino acid transport system ATP-binding protein
VALLEVDKLDKSFGGLRAVNQATLSVDSREIRALIGPNGAGKTTLFNLVAGEMPADSGRVRFDGQDITGGRPHQIAAMGISRTFQAVRLFDNMTVLENVMVGRHLRTRVGFVGGSLSAPWSRREERSIAECARDWLGFVGLTGRDELRPGSLAFGQRRLVEFARALATEPKLLLLDEPASGMNLAEVEQIAQMIRRIRDELGVAILLVEHNMSLVMDLVEQVTVLDHGQIISEGPPLQVQRDPEVIKVYLGT